MFWSDKIWPPGPLCCDKPINSLLSSLITWTMFHPEPNTQVICHYMQNHIHFLTPSMPVCAYLCDTDVCPCHAVSSLKKKKMAGLAYVTPRSRLSFIMRFKNTCLGLAKWKWGERLIRSESPSKLCSGHLFTCSTPSEIPHIPRYFFEEARNRELFVWECVWHTCQVADHISCFIWLPFVELFVPDTASLKTDCKSSVYFICCSTVFSVTFGLWLTISTSVLKHLYERAAEFRVITRSVFVWNGLLYETRWQIYGGLRLPK